MKKSSAGEKITLQSLLGGENCENECVCMCEGWEVGGKWDWIWCSHTFIHAMLRTLSCFVLEC